METSLKGKNLLPEGANSFLYEQLLIADFIGLPYFSRFPSGLKSHVLISHDFLSLSKFVLEAGIKTPKEILFCKQTRLYILHTK